MAPKTPRHRPFTPAQLRQNERFLAALRRTGNVRLACRELGVHRACYTKRRNKCAAFAASWDEALAAAHAALERAGGERLPEGTVTRDCPHSPLHTSGGEPVVVRRSNGRLQLRLAPPGWLTAAAARRILAVVEETNNVSMAARDLGLAHTRVLALAARIPAFRRSLAIACRIGQDRVLWSLIDPALADLGDWEPPDRPLAKMTIDQAMLQLIYHRPGGAFQQGAWRPRRLPRGIEFHARSIRAKISAVRRASWHKKTGSWRFPDEEE